MMDYFCVEGKVNFYPQNNKRKMIKKKKYAQRIDNVVVMMRFDDNEKCENEMKGEKPQGFMRKAK